jgi:hypothetical protein
VNERLFPVETMHTFTRIRKSHNLLPRSSVEASERVPLDGRLELDNNRSERAIKTFVK